MRTVPGRLVPSHGPLIGPNLNHTKHVMIFKKILNEDQKTQFWPHSEIGSDFRSKGIGENIAWDFSPVGSPCSESVYRWYAEYFYFDSNNPMKGRRGAEPVGTYCSFLITNRVVMGRNEVISGHLTQLLWASSEAVGCASANIWIPNKPGYVGEGMTSSYTVCHYSPQGNIIGHEKENYKPRRDGEFHFMYFTKMRKLFSPLPQTFQI